MATEYVDPDYTGTSTGSITQPWKSGADATIANDLTLLWKRGTTDVLSADIATTHSNVTFGAYGDSSNPLPVISCYITSTDTGDWTDTGGNIWTYTGGAVFDYLFLIALGSLPTNPRDHLQWHQRVNYRGGGTGTKTAFDTDGEWDNDGANPSVLYLYAPQNPVTEWGTIYLGGQNTNECIRLNSGATNVLIENLNFRFAPRGIRVNAGTSDVTAQDCVLEFCYDAITILDCNEAIIQRNYIYASARAGINLGDAPSSTNPSYLENNTITDTGYGEGVGHIYGGAAYPSHAAGLKVLENICNRSHKGIYWNGEGFGIYADNDSAYWSVERNTVTNQRDAIDGDAAFHANGGLQCKWIANKCYNCAVGFNGSDALPVDNVVSQIYNNTFIEVDIAFTFSRKPLVSGEVFQYDIYNNIATVNPAATGTTYGIIVNDDVDDLNTIVNDYNLMYGFDVEVLRSNPGTLNTAYGSNTITTEDPLLDSNYIPTVNSPCYHAGTFAAYNIKDFRGHHFHIPPTIGADEFTSNSQAVLPRYPELITGTYQVTVGNSVNSYGYVTSGGTFGSIDYDRLLMRTIANVFANNSSNSVDVWFENQQKFPRIDTLEIAVGGFTLDLLYVGTGQYSATSAVIAAYFASNNGNTIEVTITENAPAFIARTAATIRTAATARTVRD